MRSSHPRPVSREAPAFDSATAGLPPMHAPYLGCSSRPSKFPRKENADGDTPDFLHPRRFFADLSGLSRDRSREAYDRPGRAADRGRLRHLPRHAQPAARPAARLPRGRLRRARAGVSLGDLCRVQGHAQGDARRPGPADPRDPRASSKAFACRSSWSP